MRNSSGTTIYDARGRLTQTVRADGSIVKTGYDTDNNRTQSFDANGNASRTVYDERNRVVQSIDALGNITRFEYDAAGQMTAQIDAEGNRTTYEYDELGRRVAVTDALGNVTRTEYDKAGRVIAQIDALGKKTRYEYDERDRQIAVIDPTNSVTTTTYDALGNMLSITDAVNNTTTYVYDDLNRLIAETNELGATRYHRYDANSNRIATIDRNGRERAFVYDGLSRQVKEQWIDDSDAVIRSINTAYDAAGQLIAVSDPDATYRYRYDELGRQVTIDNVGTADVPNVVLNYSYDNNGNITAVSDTINGTASGTNMYSYDVFNRMTQLTQSGNNVSDKRVDFTYSPVGQFETISRYSDLAGTSPVVTTIYDYDENRRLERLSHRNSTEEVAFYDYTYDSASRITSITDIDGTHDYSYNQRDELTGAVHSDENSPDERYDYDANGNRVSSSTHNDDYVIGSNNQLTANGTYTYEYDDEGNLTKQTETATGNVRVFEWDYRNRLVAVIDSDISNTEVQRVEYRYDAMGRRIAKVVDADGDSSAAAQTLHFVYDRDDVLLEFEGEGTGPSQRYLHGPQVDQVLAQEDETGEVLWHLSDHLGTVKDLANNVGEVVNHHTYDSYGNLIVQSNESFNSRYGFTGREFDEETKLNYHRARYYSSQTGQFISQDPIGFSGQDSNLFRYVHNKPIDRVDPLGLYGYVVTQNRIISYVHNNSVLYTNTILDVINASRRSAMVSILSDSTVASIAYLPISIGSGTNQVLQLFVPDMRLFGDDMGHIVASELGGDGEDLDNLFAQNHGVNRGWYGERRWRDFERNTRRYLDNSSPRMCPRPEFLVYNVWLDYTEESLRPFQVLGLSVFSDGHSIVTPGPVPNPG